jgi:DNA-binding XRE family transcriptional regulator
MIPRGDLHPDDLAARRTLASTLWRERRRAELTTVDLAAVLGVSRSTANSMERYTSWTVRRVQDWARAVDHRFRMQLTGLTVPDDGDVYAEILAMSIPFGGRDEDRLHLLATVNDLIRCRIAAGLSCADLGVRMGVSGRAVELWEESHESTLLKLVQRYARGLGGSLALDVEPVAAAVSS